MNHERWCGELVGALEALINADRWSTAALAAKKKLKQFEAEKAAWESKHAPQTQASLFDAPNAPKRPDVPRRPYVNRPTSKAAASAMPAEVAISMRERVYQAILSTGVCGLTDEEIEVFTKISSNTIRPRRGELEDAGRIVDSGRTRAGRSGRQFTVWIVF